MEWKAEIALDGAIAGFEYYGDTNDGMPVELEFIVEDELKRNGKPGVSVGRIRWVRDGKIHYVISLMGDGTIGLRNTEAARWPMEIPPDDAEPGEGGDDDGDGEGNGEMKFRLFGRFFDGRRWRKASVGDPERMQSMRFSAGVIDEAEAEEHGDFHARARAEQVRVAVMKFEGADYSTVNVTIPPGCELTRVRDGVYKAVIPGDERMGKKKFKKA